MASAICAASPWPFGGDFVHGDRSVVLGYGVDPVGGVGREILARHGPALGGCRVRDDVGQRPAVERCAACLGDQFQRGREIWPRETLAGPRGAAVGAEMGQEVVELRVAVEGETPVPGRDVADLKARARVAYWLGEQCFEG